MSAYKIASLSIALCSGLLLASFLMAAESTTPAPHAQMNRASYDSPRPPVAPSSPTIPTIATNGISIRFRCLRPGFEAKAPMSWSRWSTPA